MCGRSETKTASRGPCSRRTRRPPRIDSSVVAALVLARGSRRPGRPLAMAYSRAAAASVVRSPCGLAAGHDEALARRPPGTARPHDRAGPRRSAMAGRRTGPRPGRRSRRPAAARRAGPGPRSGTSRSRRPRRRRARPTTSDHHEVARHRAPGRAARSTPAVPAALSGRGTSCTSRPTRTSTGRCARSGRPVGVKPGRACAAGRAAGAARRSRRLAPAIRRHPRTRWRAGAGRRAGSPSRRAAAAATPAAAPAPRAAGPPSRRPLEPLAPFAAAPVRRARAARPRPPDRRRRAGAGWRVTVTRKIVEATRGG